jgi:HD superfamily phosphohydrolase YqeK
MTDRQIVHFIHNLILETSSFNSVVKFKFEHTLRKYSFEEIDGIVTITEKFTPNKTFQVNNNIVTTDLDKLILPSVYMTLEWFEEFKLAVKHDIKTEIHNLLFDKLTA